MKYNIKDPIYFQAYSVEKPSWALWNLFTGSEVPCVRAFYAFASYGVRKALTEAWVPVEHISSSYQVCSQVDAGAYMV